MKRKDKILALLSATRGLTAAEIREAYVKEYGEAFDSNLNGYLKYLLDYGYVRRSGITSSYCYFKVNRHAQQTG